MFDALSDRFDGIFKRLRGKGKLREEDVEEVLREIRVALLEADVNFSVVKGMLAHIRERTVGIELSEALNPAQQVIKIVHDELIAALGGDAIKITFASRSEEHTSELQSLMRISYAVFCLKKKT